MIGNISDRIICLAPFAPYPLAQDNQCYLVRATRNSFAPAPGRIRAVVSPMPEVPPVMTTTCSAIGFKDGRVIATSCDESQLLQGPLVAAYVALHQNPDS